MEDDEEYFGKLMERASRTLDDVANDVRQHLSGAVENIIKAGQALQEGRDMHPSTNAFHEWCKKEFPDLKRHTRLNMMRVAKKFGDVEVLQHQVSISALYELSAPSVPEELVDDFMSSEEPVNYTEVKEAKREYKQIQEDPKFADIKEKVEKEEITPRQAVKEKVARKLHVPDYDVSEAMGALSGMAWLYATQYQGTAEEAASILFSELIKGCERDDISMSISRDRIKWFLEFKEVLDLAQPSLEAFLEDKPNLKLVN